jgi:hypothetical protein
MCIPSDGQVCAYKTQQEVFGADVIMLKALGFFLSEAQDLPGPLGKLVKPISRLYRSGQLCFSIQHYVSKPKLGNLTPRYENAYEDLGIIRDLIEKMTTRVGIITFYRIVDMHI